MPPVRPRPGAPGTGAPGAERLSYIAERGRLTEPRNYAGTFGVKGAFF